MRASTARYRGAIRKRFGRHLQEEVKQSMTLVGLEDCKNLPNGLEVPKKKLSTNSREDNVASSSHELEESG